jgi:hypothetical protein
MPSKGYASRPAANFKFEIQRTIYIFEIIGIPYLKGLIMTAQVRDIMLIDDTEFSIRLTAGNGLFKPENYGMKPGTTCTASYRGFMSVYAIEGKRLVLQNLRISFIKMVYSKSGVRFVEHEAPLLNGVIPDPTPENFIFKYAYPNVNLPIGFTGGFLVTAQPIQGPFYPDVDTWDFEKVIELIFSEGILIEKRDVSDCMASIREMVMKKNALEPNSYVLPNEAKILIKSTFKLDYFHYYLTDY